MTKCLLELFKGTGSAGKAFEGYYIESVDNESRFTPTHLTDILDWDYKNCQSGLVKYIYIFFFPQNERNPDDNYLCAARDP